MSHEGIPPQGAYNDMLQYSLELEIDTALVCVQGGTLLASNEWIEPCSHQCPCDLQVLALLHLLSIQVKLFIWDMLNEFIKRT